jgi:hypothetical protein
MHIKNRLLYMIYFQQRLFKRATFIFRKIEDVNVDKEENLFVDDYGNRKILQFDNNRTLLLFCYRGKSVKKKKKVNLIDQGEFTLFLVITFT